MTLQCSWGNNLARYVSRNNRYSPGKSDGSRYDFPGGTKNRSKGKRRIRLNPIFLTVCIILVLLIAGLCIWLAQPKANSLSSESGIPLPFADGAPFASNGQILICYNEPEVLALDASGKELWKLQIDFQPNKIEVSETLAAAYDNTNLAVFDCNGKLLFKKPLLAKLDKVVCARASIGILTQNAQEKSILVVFDSSGNEIKTLDFNTERILNFGFATELEDSLWTLVIDTEVAPVSKINTYNIKKDSLTGVTTIDGQIPERIEYKNNLIYVLGTNNLMTYDLLGVLQANQLVYGWRIQDIFWTDDKKAIFAYVPRKEGGNADSFNTVRILTLPDGEASFNLPPLCFGVFLSKDRLFCITESTMYAFDQNGGEMKKYDLGTPATEAYSVFGGKNLILQKTDGMYLIKMPE